MKRLMLVCVMILCLVTMPAGAAEVDLGTFREHSDAYTITEMDGMTAVTSTVGPYASFPLPSWGEASRALAYFAVLAYDDGETAITVPALLINVYTDRPRNIGSLTLRVDGQEFTFSWEQSPDDLSVTEDGFCQYIRITLGRENTAYIDAMNRKCTSVTDPMLLASMPLEIVFHGDEDCTAVMSDYTTMDYAAVVYAGYCAALDGLRLHIGTHPGTAMTTGGAAAAPATETDLPEAGTQPLLRDLIGTWEFEAAGFMGRTITADELTGRTGAGITMQFTSDGLWIQDIGGETMMAELAVREDGTVESPEGQSFELRNGKFCFVVNGMTMVFARSETPGPEAAGADEALLGTWYFEKLVTSGGSLPGEVPLDAAMFPKVYGVPAPTLEVLGGGYVVMTLGDSKPLFRAGEWQPEDGRLTHTETFEDGTSMTWYFVRETGGGDDPQPAGTDS